MSQSVSLVRFSELYRDMSFEWLKDAQLRELIRAVEVSREEQLRWYESLGRRTDYHIWGVEADGVPIGACGLKDVAKQSAEYWGYIAKAEFRSRGLGRKMIASCEKRAVEIGLCSLRLKVWNMNRIAQAAYLSCGFVPVRTEQDLVWMEKKLCGSAGI